MKKAARWYFMPEGELRNMTRRPTSAKENVYIEFSQDRTTLSTKRRKDWWPHTGIMILPPATEELLAWRAIGPQEGAPNHKDAARLQEVASTNPLSSVSMRCDSCASQGKKEE